MQEEEPSAPAATGLGSLDALLAALCREGRVPGLAIRVTAGETCLFEKGYGMSDLQARIPVDPANTVFRVASVSKPITATALACLVSEGALELDDPLSRYVPEFPEHGITLRQLAAHTAGIRSYRGKEYALNRPYGIADSLELFSNDPLLFEPGTGYHYNSYDYVLLSLAMERASGRPFEELVREKVLDPLGMHRTMAEVPGQAVPGQAVFYSRTRGGFRVASEVDNRYKLAGGGYLSTVGDLSRLGRACLKGEPCGKEALKAVLSPQTAAGQPTWYGLGWQVSKDAAGRPYFGHIGNGVGAYSNFFVYPEQGVVIGLLINCTDPKVQPVLDAGVEAVFLSLEGA